MDYLEDIEKAIKTLREGGMILYPTDTIWGIGCDATNAKAVESIIQLKKRPKHKSFVVLVAEERDILQYVAAPDVLLFDYLHNIQRPTTVIYEHALGLAENALAEDGSVAIRICKDDFCKHLIKRFKKPILSTSANLSGEPSPAFFNQINKEVVTGVDYVVKHRQDDQTPAEPSSIIKWQDGHILILR